MTIAVDFDGRLLNGSDEPAGVCRHGFGRDDD